MTLSKTLSTCLAVQPDETVLMVSDSGMKPSADLIWEALSKLEGEKIRLEMAPRSVHGEEPPRAVASAMKAASVVLAPTSKSLTHTKATKEAVRNGARVATMPGITPGMLSKGGMTADYTLVAKSARQVADKLTRGETIEIKTPAGTDYKAHISGRAGYADTGLLVDKGGFGNLPGGEGFIAPLEGKSKGRIVFDGPIASAGLEHEPIWVDIKEGRAVDTNYDELKEIFSEIEGASNVAEIGIGVNPRSRLIGNILEDEKVLGTAHVAFGNNQNFGGTIKAALHMDGIIKSPTILIDGQAILREGRLLNLRGH